MQVNHILILAAGKGTRMGDVGKTLPKVLWPIFEKTLLELQVLYAKKLLPTAKIHINIFNYKERLVSFIDSHPYAFENVEILLESETLDIGGAIHNLATNYNYKGNLLILNGDQFLMCGDNYINEGLNILNTSDSLLYTYNVNSSDGYNGLDIHKNRLLGIIKNEQIKPNTNIQTYTGMSLVKLESLNRSSGESSFFNTIANPLKSYVAIKQLNEFEYWDFGTIERYIQSINALLSDSESDFYRFLLEQNSINPKLQNKLNYNSKEGKLFGGLFISSSNDVRRV